MTIDDIAPTITLIVYGLNIVVWALVGYFVWKTQHIEDMHSMLRKSDGMFKRLEEKRAERMKAKRTD